MSYSVGPNHSRSGDDGRGAAHGGILRRVVASFTDIVRQYGVKGLAALVFAAMFAFAPLALLYWFNNLRYAQVIALQPGQRFQVKQARHEQDQEREQPGETALLQVVCEIQTSDAVRPLLVDDDPRRDQSFLQSANYVRREKVYLRPADVEPVPPPFALLGTPPVSVWLPAGDYEVLVVNDAPSSASRVDAPANSFPLVTTWAECSPANMQKTVCRVLLPHYDRNLRDLIGYDDGSGIAVDRPPHAEEIAALVKSYVAATAVPTPGGYILSLAEPTVRHADEHRGCTIDFAALHAVPREWTREQLATVRNWLPEDATAARARLSSLVDALGWRAFFEGWFCYAAAGVSGLVFTRWGALAMLEPWRRGESLRESIGLLVKIFLFAVGAWFLYHLLTDSSGCSGPVRFRMR